MADSTTKGVVLAALVTGTLAIVGSATKPFWYCNLIGCHEPNGTPTSSASPISSSSPTSPPSPVTTPDKRPPDPAPSPTPFMGGLKIGTNLQGQDLNDGEVTDNAAACRAKCAADDVCEAMTYVMLNPSTREHGHCWLKGGIPVDTPNPQMISAIKIRP